MIKIGHCLIITFAILLLVVVLGSFVIVDYQVPEQDIAKYTRYPTWHPPIEGMNGRKT